MRILPRVLMAVSATMVAAAVLGACSSGHQGRAGTRARSATTTSTTSGAVSAQSPTSTVGQPPATVSTTTSTTNPPETPAPGAPIAVSSPTVGQTVDSPLSVNGTSSLGTTTIQCQLTDGAGNVLVQQQIVPGANGSFDATLRFAVSQPGPGTLVLFVAGSGGQRSDLTQIPVQLGD